ncbi:tRNA adenosine(34) deaminase TadA [uncultured Dialister sp.]|jgi:tRNA(adenine34) deaminase|uniref:tRNA adenosine(34) deaminase TadA n=1 Tax=uncultured Dialister sp. TaxID=278064 RepID=UPI0026DC387F|nr:tRNA adenosine(34) deaminase TadA [uncultured Dialister sp.]
MTDREYMLLALKEAEKAADEGEIPIGAVLVYKDLIIAAGHNEKEKAKDPTAHAEITAIRKGAAFLKRWRLTGASLYVTIEPCPMCAGALLNARVSRLIYGSANPQYGAVDSRFHLTSSSVLNHTMEVTSGICKEECQALMDEFFAHRRS